ncbi:MAG: hypothetical protein Q8910_00815 [Bacteroidota bacterium]|nr:hypothetical protein [Bacteroidota bacterium]
MADINNIIYDMDVTIGGPRVDLKVEQFDVIIRQKGYRVTWEQSMYCSCYTPETGQPNYMCPVCHGLGFIYFNPIQTRMVVASISGYKDYERLGLNDMGYAYLTPQSKDKVGFRDRLTFIDFTTNFTQVVSRQAVGTPDTLRYPVTNIILVKMLDTTFYVDVDFMVDPDNPRQIHWINNTVEPGQYYSILYTTKPVYIVTNIEHELRGTYVVSDAHGGERFIELPKKFQIKREDFLHESTR